MLICLLALCMALAYRIEQLGACVVFVGSDMTGVRACVWGQVGHPYRMQTSLQLHAAPTEDASINLPRINAAAAVRGFSAPMELPWLVDWLRNSVLGREVKQVTLEVKNGVPERALVMELLMQQLAEAELLSRVVVMTNSEEETQSVLVPYTRPVCAASAPLRQTYEFGCM